MVVIVQVLIFNNFVSAGQDNLNLAKSSCLAIDIITGPVGWDCTTENGSFMIIFYGADKASINGTILTVKSMDCNSFRLEELDVDYSDLRVVDSRNFIGKEEVSRENPVKIKCSNFTLPHPTKEPS